jgi:uncharacterized protein YegJ (DUF2314 family)
MFLMLVAAWAAAVTAQPVSAQGTEDRIISFSAADAEMNAAIAKGQATLPDFFEHFAQPAEDEAEFMVKYDIVPGDDAEYVWASLQGRSGATLTGTLINQPEYTKDMLGDQVVIQQADVIDWAYRKGRVMQGSFTTRVMLAHMPEGEAAEYRDALGW